jgi:hypothetical protein
VSTDKVPSEYEETVNHLERDQLVSGRRVHLPAAHLGGAAQVGLWALRIFVLVVSVMVIYTFIAQLGS